MAYLDLTSGFADISFAPAQSRTAEPALPVEAGFSGLEWSVILLAAKDRLSSLTQPGRVSRAIGSLFGIGETSRLADSRLEALRRMAVQAWHHGYALPASEIGRFVENGFTVYQAETLLASIATRRASQRRPRQRMRIAA